ncbi:MAG: SGNH/GDSL hydrolase N-terminal domain-containing protein, partial [Kiritimatiellota bacterium]|nr:SGNH/GDSL hydrolase N-terminal domain-containing protein [Kiritimatiellota bacterium]
MRAKTVADPQSLTWISAADRRLTVRGLAWFRENRGRFCRVPLRAKGKVSDGVWALAQCPASAHVAFRSDTTELAVRVTNENIGLMPHMAASGSNGLALQCGAPLRMRPWGVAKPDLNAPSFERSLFKGIPAAMREFRLYLPLYKGLETLALGFSRRARILPPSAPALR